MHCIPLLCSINNVDRASSQRSCSSHHSDVLHAGPSAGSSWKAFFKKVAAVNAEKGAETFVHPRVVHGILKFILATIGMLLNLLGLRSTMTYTSLGCDMTAKNPSTLGFDLAHFSWGEEESCTETGPEMLAFWLAGVFLTALSFLLGSFPGRRFVLLVTNSLSKSIGIVYKMHEQTMVIKAWHTPTPGLRGEPGRMNTMAAASELPLPP